MKKKILIVGGTGFLGHNFAKKCLKNNFKVISISRNKPKKERFLKKVKYLYADISKKGELIKILNFKFNYIVNFGGDVNHHEKITFKSHFNGCKNLANITLKKKIEKFIQIGSSVEYANQKVPHSEDKKKENLSKLKSIYAKAKLSSSYYLLELFKKKKLPVIILRPYLVYGPGQDTNRLIPFVIKNCLKNEKFPCSNGLQLRDFVYIDDAINLIFESLKNRKIEGEIFNLCSGKPIKVKEVINLINKKINKGKPEFGKILFRKDEVNRFYGNPNKAKKIYNWKVKTNIKEGLNRTIKFYENYFKKNY